MMALHNWEIQINIAAERIRCLQEKDDIGESNISATWYLREMMDTYVQLE